MPLLSYTSADLPNVIGEVSGGGSRPRSSNAPSLIAAVSSSSALSASVLDVISRLRPFRQAHPFAAKAAPHACLQRSQARPLCLQILCRPIRSSFLRLAVRRHRASSCHARTDPVLGRLARVVPARHRSILALVESNACRPRARAGAPCASRPCRWCPGLSRRSPRPLQRSIKASSRKPSWRVAASRNRCRTVSSVGALWRTDLRPARRNRGARCGLVCRHPRLGRRAPHLSHDSRRACRNDGSRWPCCSHKWQAIQPRSG